MPEWPLFELWGFEELDLGLDVVELRGNITRILEVYNLLFGFLARVSGLGYAAPSFLSWSRVILLFVLFFACLDAAEVVGYPLLYLFWITPPEMLGALDNNVGGCGGLQIIGTEAVELPRVLRILASIFACRTFISITDFISFCFGLWRGVPVRRRSYPKAYPLLQFFQIPYLSLGVN